MITIVIKDSIESERFFSVHGTRAVEMLSKLHDNYWCGDGLLYVLSSNHTVDIIDKNTVDFIYDVTDSGNLTFYDGIQEHYLKLDDVIHAIEPSCFLFNTLAYAIINGEEHKFMLITEKLNEYFSINKLQDLMKDKILNIGITSCGVLYKNTKELISYKTGYFTVYSTIDKESYDRMLRLSYTYNINITLFSSFTEVGNSIFTFESLGLTEVLPLDSSDTDIIKKAMEVHKATLPADAVIKLNGCYYTRDFALLTINKEDIPDIQKILRT